MHSPGHIKMPPPACLTVCQRFADVDATATSLSSGVNALEEEVWLPEIPDIQVQSPEKQASAAVSHAQVGRPPSSTSFDGAG